jgi:hypothetical protein
LKSITILTALLLSFSMAGAAPPLRDCNRGISQLNDVSLVWTPTNAIEPPGLVTIPPGASVAPGAMMSATLRISVKALTDIRPDPKRIGQNLESTSKGCVFPVTTKDDAAAWTTDRLRFVLGRMGFDAVEQGSDVAISGELRKFFVSEDNVYSGAIGLRLDVTKADKIIWSGLVMGSNTRFGRSYKLENYQETLSDCVIDAVEHLAEDASFVRAVSP